VSHAAYQKPDRLLSAHQYSQSGIGRLFALACLRRATIKLEQARRRLQPIGAANVWRETEKPATLAALLIPTEFRQVGLDTWGICLGLLAHLQEVKKVVETLP